jgi:hypothetical protein
MLCCNNAEGTFSCYEELYGHAKRKAPIKNTIRCDTFLDLAVVPGSIEAPRSPDKSGRRLCLIIHQLFLPGPSNILLFSLSICIL